MGAVTVRNLSVTPVKGTRMHGVDRVVLDRDGALGDRRFFLIDSRGRMVNGKHLGELTALVAEYGEDEGVLRLEFPGGRTLKGEVRLGDAVEASFYSQPVAALTVQGPWSGAISEYAGQPLRLVQASDGRSVDRGPEGGVTLISSASLEKLAEVGDRDEVDPRRFRMLMQVDGLDAHGEDAWIGRAATIGEATVRFEGHVGRCMITGRDPDTGKIDVPTLDILERYRGGLGTTEPLAFGIYGRVLAGGMVRVGDPLTLDGGPR